MKKTLAVLALPLFAGCSIINLNPSTWFNDDEVDPPAELQAIDEEVELRRIWSANIGNGQGGDYFELTPAIDGERIFAASQDGNIYGFELESGDALWRTRLDDEAVTGGVGAGRGLVLVGTADAEVIAFNQFTGEEVVRGECHVRGIDRIKRRVERDHDKTGLSRLLDSGNNGACVRRSQQDSLGPVCNASFNGCHLGFVVAINLSGIGRKINAEFF